MNLPLGLSVLPLSPEQDKLIALIEQWKAELISAWCIMGMLCSKSSGCILTKSIFSLIEIHWLQLDINRGFRVTQVCCICIFSTPFILFLRWFLLSYTVLPCSFHHYAPSAMTRKLYSQSIDLKPFPAEVLMSSALTRGLRPAVGSSVTRHSHCESPALPLMREHAGACRSQSANNPRPHNMRS